MPFVCKDEEGIESGFFAFPDLSIQKPGRYRLRFVLVKFDPFAQAMPGTKEPLSAKAISGVVTVYSREILEI